MVLGHPQSGYEIAVARYAGGETDDQRFSMARALEQENVMCVLHGDRAAVAQDAGMIDIGCIGEVG
jgi:hypothetical protein